MPMLTFDWDPGKARADRIKHGVSFDQAKTAFLDEYARIIPDPEHSDDEERFVLPGMRAGLRLLVVCRCYRVPGNLLRIISARRADKSERREYARYLP